MAVCSGRGKSKYVNAKSDIEDKRRKTASHFFLSLRSGTGAFIT